MYLGSIDQYEEQFQFILDVINSGLPYDRIVCIIYMYTHPLSLSLFLSLSPLKKKTYPTAIRDILNEISYAQYCIILCSDEYLCLYMSFDAKFLQRCADKSLA
jgi:hypothetical protein